MKSPRNYCLIGILSIFCCLTETKAQTVFDIEMIATGFSSPVDIACSYDSRLFIVEQSGVVRVIENGSTLPDPFLSITSIVRSGGERGLLGFAFDPDYANNGYFFVSYTAQPNGDSVISRFSVSGNDPNLADPDSELEIIRIPQPQSNHNGGDINFGPDGYLYIGIGDGGGGGDDDNNSQNTALLLGKILRLDVSNATAAGPYVVPNDNPFVGAGDPLDEIWSIGWRNPWRFSFDRDNGNMWVGDVGQGAREEISFEAAGDLGGKNYGWRCYEGNNAFNTTGCDPASSYVFPVYDYASSGSDCSVTGGYVYRGAEYPNLQGMYIFSDYCSGRFRGVTPDGQGGYSGELLLDSQISPSAFGQGENGDLFVADLGGDIYKITGDSNLPVEITSLSAQNSSQGVELQWETSSETNNSHFEIERSSDDNSFEVIGRVNGVGNSLETQNYLFVDTNVSSLSRLYYRLKQVDFDGRFSYSPSISIDPSKIALATFTIYPNPVESDAFVRFQNTSNEELTLQIFDIRGALVSSKRLDGNGGVEPIEGLGALSPGTYFIQLKGQGAARISRFVKR